MNWFKKLFRLKETKDETPKEIKKPEEPKKEIKIDTREILKDKNGEDLICSLCGNQDNETKEYFPIREGDKTNFHGKDWHIKCLRMFKKYARDGN